MTVEIGNVPAVEAINNLRSKLAIPTKHWDDLLSLPRAKAFTVAGATKMDLLNGLHEDITKALEDGESIGQFRKRFDATVQKHGWTYNGKRGWRTRVIYDTNLRSAHAAGEWERIQRNKALLPYLVYKTRGDSTVRDQHRAWHDTVLPVDDPWWSTHKPLNGWGCHCSTLQVNERQLKRMGLTVNTEAPPINRTRRINPSTGEDYGMVPEGIDVGFDHNVGEEWLMPDSLFGEKLMALPVDVRRAATANDGLQFRKMAEAFDAWARKTLSEDAVHHKQFVAGWMQDDVINALAERGITPKTALIAISDSRLRRMRRKDRAKDSESEIHNRPSKRSKTEVPEELLPELPRLLKSPKAVLLDSRGALVFVLDHEDNVAGKLSKLVVEVNVIERGSGGNVANALWSAGQVNSVDLKNAGMFTLLTGEL